MVSTHVAPFATGLLSRRIAALPAFAVATILAAPAIWRADDADARAFSLNFEFPAARSTAVVNPSALLSSTRQEGASPDSHSGPGEGSTGAVYFSSDLLAMTVIPPDNEAVDVPQPTDQSVVGFTGLLSVPAPVQSAAPVQRAAFGVFDLTPRRSPGFAGSSVKGLPSPTVAAVPVPPTLALLVGGLAGLALLRWRRRSDQPASA
ncbi:MAG: hypothetical protein ACWA5A_09625 [Marinibacterium sp.]